MKKFNFLICYEKSHEKRLPKVARVLERTSIRIQKSLFFYPEASKEDISNIVNDIEEIIKKDSDDVRIYKIDINSSIHFGSAIDLKNPIVV